mgnify:CR=1 FL=1
MPNSAKAAVGSTRREKRRINKISPIRNNPGAQQELYERLHLDGLEKEIKMEQLQMKTLEDDTECTFQPNHKKYQNV